MFREEGKDLDELEIELSGSLVDGIGRVAERQLVHGGAVLAAVYVGLRDVQPALKRRHHRV